MNKFCVNPLLVFNVTPRFVIPCCYSYLSPSHRSSLVVDAKECGTAWNSEQWVNFRKRIAAQDYSLCTNCALYANQETEFYDEARLRAEYPDAADAVMKMIGGEGDIERPETVILSFDPTCNLACPTCRGRVYREANTELLDSVVESISGVLSTAKHIVIAGDGEVCMSRHYMDILRNRTGNAKLTIMSNGTILGEPFWSSLSEDVKTRIERVHISCDGTTREIYEYTRRNGVFERFLANMEYLMKVREQYGFTTKLLYTISTINMGDYLNLPAFARKLQFDQICMTLANKWYRIFNGEHFSSDNVITDETKRKHIERNISLLNKSYRR